MSLAFCTGPSTGGPAIRGSMTVRVTLDRKDQEIAREALAYVSRRVFEQHGAEIIGDLEDWLDELLLRKGGPAPGTILMTEEHLHAFRSALQSYSDALDHPSSDRSNRMRIVRMKRIMSRAAAQGRWHSRLWNWVRALGRRR